MLLKISIKSTEGYYLLSCLMILSGNIQDLRTVNANLPTPVNEKEPHSCFKLCMCGGTDKSITVDCSSLNLTHTPRGLGVFTIKLDLSNNHFYRLSNVSLAKLHYLEILNLAYNDLSDLPDDLFVSVLKLRTLNLRHNRFDQIPTKTFRKLKWLVNLHLDGNPLHSVDPHGFEKLKNLAQLWLNSTGLKDIPVEALRYTPALEALTLANNKIEQIPNHAFQNLSKLSVLLLYQNHIDHVGVHSFSGLVNLKVLHLEHNVLSEMPTALSQLPRLKELSLSNNQLSYIPDSSFTHNKNLTVLNIQNNPVESVGKFAFSNLPLIKSLILSEARQQSIFPDLHGNVNLDILSLDRCSITKLPDNLCQQAPNIRSFDIHANQLTFIPKLNQCSKLKALNLKSNKISSLEGGLFSNLSGLTDLTLSDNHIETVPEHAFRGLSSLLYLDLQNNHISSIHTRAFVPLKSLEEINLGDNIFPVLPTEGLQKIRNLKAFNNYQLKDFPAREHFPVVETLTLSWAYHCCEYVTDEEEGSDDVNDGLKEGITFIDEHPLNIDDITNLTRLVPFEPSDWQKQMDLMKWKKHSKANSSTFKAFEMDLWDEFEGYNYGYPYVSDGADPQASPQHHSPQYYGDDTLVVPNKKVVCKPRPGPFWPCKDLMGWWFIRCGMWAVFLLALIGNGTVLLVSIVARNKTDVPRFLICSLACADLLMGVYLGFLAIVDASSFGEFKKYAIKWQTSAGCQIAGFLGVLSSELSVYTLTVITMERYYAITHAVHINKRLCFKHASYIMSCGWLFAVIMAVLPLVGVSDYRKFAVCLPFETSNAVSLGYIAFLMLMNMIAFLLIVGCYAKMYWAIRGSSAWNSNDSRVAKRMAILIFTDFFCWAPISFFSLTAAFGRHLVSLEDAKIFTIFVLPLNSCANPFLYAILTKQFKKDCSTFCKRIEESTINRNINRFNQRNSVTWGSSRRPSALNSFFEKRDSVSRQSLSGGSAPATLQTTSNPFLSTIRGLWNSHSGSKRPKRTCIHIRGEDLMAAYAPNVEVVCPNPSANNGGEMVAPPVFDSTQDICICHSHIDVNEKEFNSNSDSSTGGTCIAHFFRNSKRGEQSNRIHKKLAHSLSCPVRKETRNDLSILQLVPLKCSPGGARKQSSLEENGCAQSTFTSSPSKRTAKDLQVNLSRCCAVPSPKLLSAGDESIKTAETEVSFIAPCLENGYSQNNDNNRNEYDGMDNELFPSTPAEKQGDVHFKEKARLLGLKEEDLSKIPCNFNSTNTKGNNSSDHIAEIYPNGARDRHCNNVHDYHNSQVQDSFNSSDKQSNNVDVSVDVIPKPLQEISSAANKDVICSDSDSICDSGLQGGILDSIYSDQGNSINKQPNTGNLQQTSAICSNDVDSHCEKMYIPNCDSKFNFPVSTFNKQCIPGKNKEEYETCDQSNCRTCNHNSEKTLGLKSENGKVGGGKIKLNDLKSVKVDSEDSSSELDQLLQQ